MAHVKATNFRVQSIFPDGIYLVGGISRLGNTDAWQLALANTEVPFGRLFQLVRDAGDPDEASVAYTQCQSAFFEDAESHGQLREAIINIVAESARRETLCTSGPGAHASGKGCIVLSGL